MAQKADKATAMWVIRRLRAGGYQGLLAGGCVRDMLLNRPSHDYDIATDATPDEVRRLFSRVLMIGAKFGVAMVLSRHGRTRKDRMIEVATFRSDLSYSDGRRPDGVSFSSPREDAKRRDFTINGMFYDPITKQVIDYVGGKRDLAAGVVRTIGRADKRFSEDYLRMIRAVRFAVRLDFQIARDTAAGIRKLAPRIENISGERICDELTKMLSETTACEALGKLMQLHLAPHIFPELFDSADAWAVGVRRVEAVTKKRDAVLNFGALLCDVSTTAIRRIIRRWGASNEFKDALVWLSEHRDDWTGAPEMQLCKFKRLMAGPHWPRLRELWKVRERIETTRAGQSRRIARRAGTIAPETISPPPLVSGEDLMKMGLAEGRKLGRILQTLYDAQLNEEIKNRREAITAAKKRIAVELDKNS